MYTSITCKMKDIPRIYPWIIKRLLHESVRNLYTMLLAWYMIIIRVCLFFSSFPKFVTKAYFFIHYSLNSEGHKKSECPNEARWTGLAWPHEESPWPVQSPGWHICKGPRWKRLGKELLPQSLFLSTSFLLTIQHWECLP